VVLVLLRLVVFSRLVFSQLLARLLRDAEGLAVGIDYSQGSGSEAPVVTPEESYADG